MRGRMVFGVHGFQFDPSARLGDPTNPETDVFALMRGMVERTRQDGNFRPITPHRFVPFSWYSYPPGWQHVLRAWGRGHWYRYRAAWADTDAAARRLEKAILWGYQDQELPNGLASIVGHSLGTRVVLKMLELPSPQLVGRVLLLSGSDTVEHAIRVIERNPTVQFMNVVVEGDGILKIMGETFVPGIGRDDVIGLHRLEPLVGVHVSNVRDVVLSSAQADDHRDAYRDGNFYHIWREHLGID